MHETVRVIVCEFVCVCVCVCVKERECVWMCMHADMSMRGK